MITTTIRTSVAAAAALAATLSAGAALAQSNADIRIATGKLGAGPHR